MAKKMETLKVEAIKACRNRNHRMKRFTSIDATTAYAECMDCGMGVTVNTKPMPNQIDIGGEAVALNCQTFDKAVVALLRKIQSGTFNGNPYSIAEFKAVCKQLAVKHELTEWMDAPEILEKRFNPIV